jgi:predicted nucleotidyltransferase
MRPSVAVAQHRDEIRRLILASGLENPRLFGSVVHGDDKEGSDIDILVDPLPKTSLLDICKVQVKLESLTGMKVDLRTPGFLHEKFRQHVLNEAVPV